jgi:HAD superfamily hydrolase (TIGR01509 family)
MSETEHLKVKIKSVIFDLGRVLVNVDFTRGLFRYLTPHESKTDQEILSRIFREEIFIAFSTGKLKAVQLYQSLCAKYHLDLTYDLFVREWCDIFAPMEGMEELVGKVAKYYQLGLLSDTDPLHWPYCLEKFSFLKQFERPTLSYETGLLKPDPQCYHLAAKNCSTSLENCLFIDDREENVAGARQTGMSALQFKGVESLRVELMELQIISDRRDL